MPKHLYEEFQVLLDKNFIPYEDPMDYICSSIKEIVFPSLTFEVSTQTIKRGKKINWKESGNIYDKYQHDLDITFRSVDSHLNFFMLMQVLDEIYVNTEESYAPDFNIAIIDKNGDLIYTILLKDVIFKSLSEQRLSYQVTDFSEKTFSVTFTYNWIDITWDVHEKTGYINQPDKSIFDIPGVVVPSGRDINEKLLPKPNPNQTSIDKITSLPHIKNGKDLPNNAINPPEGGSQHPI